MSQGQLVGDDADLDDPPLDTGEAIGSPVGGLTVTIGYGPSLFDDRFGLAQKKPALLVDLPALPNENLDPTYTGGDLCVQACSDDPLVAFHAVRNLARLGMGVVDYNWMELGFGKTSSTSTAQATPRNLLGFKDGTRNIKAQQTELLDQYVWVGDETDQDWMKGRQLPGGPPDPDLHRELGPRLPRGPAERHRPGQGSGAPLTGGDRVHHAEIRGRRTTRASWSSRPSPHPPGQSRGERRDPHSPSGLLLHRRHRLGHRHPSRWAVLHRLHAAAEQFVTLQQKLGTSDALNEYIQHIGSGLFAVPGGLRRGQHWGDGLFT